VNAVDAMIADWEAQGERVPLGPDGGDVWVARVPAAEPSGAPPVLVLHGFPTCSFDSRPVLEPLRAGRDVVLFDFVGFGLSAKPDRRYGLRMHADVAEAVAEHLGLTEVDLVTHDIGDSVGGELLRRSLEGSLGFTVRRRVLTNGSIYMDLVQLSEGQKLLLALPDAAEPAVGADGGVAFKRAVAATFAAESVVPDAELEALAALAVREGGLALLPRTIRYVEDRLAEEHRFTGAIEEHPSPVAVVWGDADPIAVVAMVDRLRDARPDAEVTILEGVGHYPMLEAPDAFAAAVLAGLDD
jgi:pimeloyl-ACP methyl ester carboxylesterase